MTADPRERFGVAAHARLQPDKVAIVAGDRRITYRELDERATRAARGRRVLRHHPAVAEVAVIGAPDPEWDERVRKRALRDRYWTGETRRI